MNRHRSIAIRLAVVFAVALVTGGCAAARVKPWDRDLLARPSMRLVPLPLEAEADAHIYFSKEGSMGGADVGGGGCGCN